MENVVRIIPMIGDGQDQGQANGKEHQELRDLCVAACDGNDSAFTAIVDATNCLLARKISCVVRGPYPHDHEDILQRCWSDVRKAVCDLGMLASDSDIRAWMIRVAKCRAIDWLRKSSRRRSRELAIDHVQEPLVMTDKDRIAKEQAKDFVQELLLNLGSFDKEVVLLRLDGFSRMEIAERLSVSEGTVANAYTRINKVAKGLRCRDIGKEADGAGDGS